MKNLEDFITYNKEKSDDYGDRYDIVINEELACILDGRCFLDYDMPDRIEGFKFTKTKNGIDILSIGCDAHWGYTYNYHDDYGEYLDNDTFTGCDIIMIAQNHPLLKEISLEMFQKMNEVINERIILYGQRDAEFEKLRKKFYNSKN